MQYQVPQFIEVEDKLFGPLTFKQFLYLGGGLGFGYIAKTYLPSYIGIFVGLGGVALGLSFAFLKINNKPFMYIVEAFFRFLLHPRLYVWRKVQKREVEKKKQAEATPEAPRLSDSKLKDLAWSLDIHDRSAEGLDAPGLTGNVGDK